MERYIEVTLRKRGVSCVARMLTTSRRRRAKRCGMHCHRRTMPFTPNTRATKFIVLSRPLRPSEIGLENPTIMPIPGDILYFFFPPGTITLPSVRDVAYSTGMVDLAIFYGRDNLIFSPTMGPVPGNRFAEVTEKS